MPRHPPCALNNEHTNHPHNKKSCSGHTSELDKKLIKEKRNHTNTHKQTTRPIHLCLMLASTIQFSHNTPTTNQHTHYVHQLYGQAQKRGIMPQTPNNAPTYKQHYFLFNCAWTTCVTKRHSNTWSCLIGVCFTRTIFNNKSWQHDTRILNQPQGATAPEK